MALAERVYDEHNQDKFKWDHLNDLKPLSVTLTTDMAADWKLVGAGGGVKNTEMFCNLCSCTSSDVHQPNEEHCDRHCSSKDADWRCYHHSMLCHGTSKEQLLAEVEQLKQSINSDLLEIERRSKIKYYSNPSQCLQHNFNKSIHFQPTNSNEEEQFISLLMDELMMRGLSPVGSLEALRQRLKNEVETERKLWLHLKKLEHCTKVEQSLIVLLHKIPCILHCENRVGIKLLTLVLHEGFDNVKEGLLFGHIRSVNDRITAYIKEVERILNTVILGEDDGPAQWVLPYNPEKKTVGIICLDDNCIQKILNHYELLVELSVCNQARLQKYNFGTNEYRNAMVILCQKREFVDEEIVMFQTHIDLWFQAWNELWGSEGCTNYTHMLSSGHMVEYMFKWRNMYRFSQQGWEKFNHVFTTVYFRRANHGGKKHADFTNCSLVTTKTIMDDRSGRSNTRSSLDS
jgi:hypothetical protein